MRAARTMTARERLLAVLDFKTPDRLPKIEWAPWWDKTLARWAGEGLPPSVSDDGRQRAFGLEPLRVAGAAPDIPYAAAHGAGVVASAEDYEPLRAHAFSDALVARAADEARALKARHDAGEISVRVWLDGFFWFPRRCFGIEPHLYAFYDQPALMKRMCADLLAFNLRVLDAALSVLRPEFVGLAEDMSYNGGPMLSEAAFREFLLPNYVALCGHCRAHGLKVLVDTDGDATQMLPWLLAGGAHGVYPLERQAGVDVARIRRDFPRLIMLGGYDKMVMDKGEAAMRAEFERLLPVMRSGGYVPSVDHQTPPGVSLAQYRCYLRLFDEYCVKGAR